MKHFLLFLSLFILLSAASFGQDAAGQYKKASELYDKGEYSSAVTAIDKALQQEPDNLRYLALKGSALEKAEKFQEAFAVYTLAIKTNPTDSYGYNQRGLLLMKAQRGEFAADDFGSALAFEKNDTTRLLLLLNRGAAKNSIRDFQGAYDDYRGALQLDSLNVGTLNNLAAVSDEVGKGEQTLGYLFRIIRIDPKFIGAYANIGFKYQEMGDYKKAIGYYNKVLELAPNEPLGYSNRAYNRYKLKDYKGALADINTSLKLYPDNSYAYRTRALIYLAEKSNAKACADLAKALEMGYTKMYGEEAEQLKKQHCK